MDTIKKYEDSLHNIIEQEIRKRDDIIKELRAQKPRLVQNGDTGAIHSELEKCKKELHQKTKRSRNSECQIRHIHKIIRGAHNK